MISAHLLTFTLYICACFVLQHRILSPFQVLVRLRVEHAGFPAVNQQRFGAQFVGMSSSSTSSSSSSFSFSSSSSSFSSPLPCICSIPPLHLPCLFLSTHEALLTFFLLLYFLLVSNSLFLLNSLIVFHKALILLPII